jgi:predicted nucleotidyltransferase
MAAIPTLISQLKEELTPILDGLPVSMAYLYGSAASGQTTPFSDVDIALYLTEPLPPRERLGLELGVEIALEDALGIANADVRVINDAPLMVRGTVVQEGALLYCSDDEGRVDFESLTLKLYLDFEPAAEMFREIFFKRLREEGLGRGKSKKARRHPGEPRKIPGFPA